MLIHTFLLREMMVRSQGARTAYWILKKCRTGTAGHHRLYKLETLGIMLSGMGIGVMILCFGPMT
jgi:hypothetical protein